MNPSVSESNAERGCLNLPDEDGDDVVGLRLGADRSGAAGAAVAASAATERRRESLRRYMGGSFRVDDDAPEDAGLSGNSGAIRCHL